MENAEEILQCLDEFAKLRPKEIPPELEYYLSFVARTGDPVYQWPLIKCLFREKLLNVITEFYEACPSVEIPPCPNVEIFNYEAMKGFILEKLDTFAAAPFTVQRICELLTSPRKEYNRIDKYMRALEKNILVVSTREPGNRKSTENGESVVNGLESEHGSQEMVNSLNSDINVEVDMDEKTVWHKSYAVNESNIILESSHSTESIQIQESYVSESKTSAAAAAAAVAAAVAAAAPIPPTESVITTRQINYIGYTNEMLVEPSTTISSNETPDNNSDADSGVPTGVFNLTRPAEKEEEQIYVTEESAFTKADCSEMETSQIISETETEPITPPEPEGSAEEAPHVEKAQPESSEAIVESSSQARTTSQLISTTASATTASATTAAATTTSSSTTTTKEADPEKEISSNENETTISSSDESSTTHLEVETNPDPEISASDQQEVTESNIVIGPEDMQVEDISPEPETQAEVEAEPEAEAGVETNTDAEIETEIEAEAETSAKAESSKPPTISDEIVAAPETPKTPETPEIPEIPETAQEVVNVDNSTKTENPRGSSEGSAGSEGDAPQVEGKTETPPEIVKVTESN